MNNVAGISECPKCGHSSYSGGVCFDCGTKRPGKHNKENFALDSFDFMSLMPGTRMVRFQEDALGTEATERDTEQFVHAVYESQ